MAWADALQKSLHELGVVGITAQDINAVAMNGINAVVKFNRMKRRIVTSTEPIVLSANRVKIYILIQVQRNVNGPDDFYSLNTANFKDTSFNKKMKGLQCPAHRTLSLLGPRLCARHGTAAQKAVWGRGFFYHKRSRLCRRNRSNGVYACFLRLQDKIHARCRKIRSYADKRDNCANVRNGFIAGAAVLYVWNVIDGIAAKGKKKGIALGDAQLRMAPMHRPKAEALLWHSVSKSS